MGDGRHSVEDVGRGIGPRPGIGCPDRPETWRMGEPSGGRRANGRPSVVDSYLSYLFNKLNLTFHYIISIPRPMRVPGVGHDMTGRFAVPRAEVPPGKTFSMYFLLYLYVFMLF